jgi:hypothetical protein
MAADETSLFHGVKHLFEKTSRNSLPSCNRFGLNRHVTVMQCKIHGGNDSIRCPQ